MTDPVVPLTAGQAMAATLAEARDRLKDTDDPMREARLLLAHAAGLDHGHLHRLEPEDFTPGLRARLLRYADRRASGEPLSKIMGYRDFWKHRFTISEDVLDPRPDTERLVEAALSVRFDKMLDLGTGSGCILLSVLADRPAAQGVGADISEAALKIARMNATEMHLGDRADFVVSDWFDAVSGKFDLIVSNPPYISAADMTETGPELAFDPRSALTDEGDGLAAYRVIIPGAGAHLLKGGHLLVEIGWNQGDAVSAMAHAAGFGKVRVLADMEGRDRVVQGVWPG